MSSIESIGNSTRAADNVAAARSAQTNKYGDKVTPDGSGPGQGPGDASLMTMFADFIDIINPLQHIPILSGFYRELTGDEISPHAQVVGDALFMGPVGAVASMANLAVKDFTGNDVGGHVASLFFGDDSDAIEPTLAENNTQQQASLATADTMLMQAQLQAQSQTQLDPSAVFSFPDATQPIVQTQKAAPPVKTADYGALSQTPVALEALPADILAALYSGQSVNPARGVSQNASIEEAPRWNLWQQVDTPNAIEPANMVPQALFPRALNSYQSSANLTSGNNHHFLSTVQ